MLIRSLTDEAEVDNVFDGGLWWFVDNGVDDDAPVVCDVDVRFFRSADCGGFWADMGIISSSSWLGMGAGDLRFCGRGF